MSKVNEEMTLEQAFSIIEEDLKELESQDITLDESFKVYRDGMELLKFCSEKIDKVEKEIILMNEEGEQDVI